MRKDIFSEVKRSSIMASIKSANTGIESILDGEMKKAGFKYKRHVKMPGKPDFVFPQQRVAVFCHGDFWHGKNYKKMKPKLNAYWRAKIEGNMKRDKLVVVKLNRLGWNTVGLNGSRIMKDAVSCVEKIKKKLKHKSIDNYGLNTRKWFCLRYHKKKPCSEIARKYKVSRQAVSASTIALAHKVLLVKRRRLICPACESPLKLTIQSMKNFVIERYKKYAPFELRYIKKHYGRLNAKRIAKRLRRTESGVSAKMTRMGITQKK